MPIKISNHFKILPGFTPQDSVKDFVLKKINTVYVGFYDEYSEKKWPVAFNTINRRGEGGSFFGKKEFKIFIKEATKYNLSVYVVFNVNYTKQQIPWVIKSIKFVSKFSTVKGIIVNDINLLLLLKNYKKELIVSTLGANLNCYAIEFYKEFGAKRIVLDRQLTAKEVLHIINKFPDINFEIFPLMADGCFFIDGYCTSLHIQEKESNIKYDNSINSTLCMKVFNSLKIKNKNIVSNMRPYKCNLCLLYFLIKYNNVTIKIPNRTITDSTGIQIIDTIHKMEKQLNYKNITLQKFKKYCAVFLLKNKKTKCNSKICLCRDLYEKNSNN